MLSTKVPKQICSVQVYIPVFNDIRYFPRALSSVLTQGAIDVQVIVSDNASTDGTYEYALEAAAKDSRVIVHRNPRNVGAIENLNRFADYVTADFFMLLCSDDMLGSRTALRQAYDILDREPEVVSVYCDMVYIDGKDRKIFGRRFGRSGTFDAHAVLRGSILSYRNLFGIPLLHRRSACIDIRYPERITYVADVYFAARTAERGRVYHIPDSLIWNRFTGGNMTRALVHDSRRQFAELARVFGVSLGRRDQLIRAARLALVVPSKHLFLRFARWRAYTKSH
jgi:glycosyltransferase involved in cell wall biosynthesis